MWQVKVGRQQFTELLQRDPSAAPVRTREGGDLGWCMAHRRALEYFGGTPQRHWVDNLKSGVNRPGREDFVLNGNFRDCAGHYSVAVMPGRPGHAREKGMMEGAVGTVQTVLFLPLRGVPFFRHRRDEPSHLGRARRSQRPADAEPGREPPGSVRSAGESGTAAVVAAALGMERMAEHAQGGGRIAISV